MQGITVALFFAGIEYFTKAMVSGDLQQHLKNLQPLPYTVPTIAGPLYQYPSPGAESRNECTNLNIQISNGSLSNYSPVFQSVYPQGNGTFQLAISSSASFNANYTWNETYTAQPQSFQRGDRFPGYWYNNGSTSQPANKFDYSVGIGSLNATFDFTFTFNELSKSWDLPITAVTADAQNVSPNIPANSIVNDEDSGNACAGPHISQATTNSVDNIDFKSSIQTTLQSNLDSIPASGQLFQDPQHGTITFAFGLGDSPLTFPDSGGLSVGVTGISTYTPVGQPTQQFSGTPPTGLPVPSTVQPLPVLFGGIPSAEAANFDAKNVAAIIKDFNTYSPQIPDPNQPNQTVPKYPLIDPTVTVITPGSEWQVFDSSDNNMFQVQLNTQKNTLDVHGLYHLQMYVSDYTLNGLYWAFTQAQQLNMKLTAGNCPDPAALKVMTYVSNLPELGAYKYDAFEADAIPNKPPTVTFEPIYYFSGGIDQSNDFTGNMKAISVLTTLAPSGTSSAIAQQIAQAIATAIVNSYYSGSAVVMSDSQAKADLELFLNGQLQTILQAASTTHNLNWSNEQIQTTATNDVAIIESAVTEFGAVVTHDIQMTLSIPDGTVPPNTPGNPHPYIEFSVSRTDFLPGDSLVLGIQKTQSGEVQTLQFQFSEITSSVTYINSNIPFAQPDRVQSVFNDVWINVGDAQYHNVLNSMGQKGVPLPIMKGFQFLFEMAQLNIEEGYISVLSTVEMKSS